MMDKNRMRMGDPEQASLQDLLAAMGSMRARRIPQIAPQGAPAAVPAMAPEMPPQGAPAGMDPRLLEIIRKKQAGR